MGVQLIGFQSHLASLGAAYWDLYCSYYTLMIYLCQLLFHVSFCMQMTPSAANKSVLPLTVPYFKRTLILCITGLLKTNWGLTYSSVSLSTFIKGLHFPYYHRIISMESLSQLQLTAKTLESPFPRIYPGINTMKKSHLKPIRHLVLFVVHFPSHPQ